MKIYTRTGDEGETGLFGGERVSKSCPRVRAYGEVDEALSYLGVVRAELARQTAPDGEIDEVLVALQDDLFVAGCDLATPRRGVDHPRVVRLEPRHVERLENWIDHFDGQLPEMTHFILPGGTPAGAGLLYARTLVRRAERSVVELSAHENTGGHLVIYLNRLSDLLFVLGRTLNHRAGVPEQKWNAGPA